MTIDKLTMEEKSLARDRIEQKILLSSTPVSSTQIEKALGLHQVVVRNLLRELRKAGRIRERGQDGNNKLWEWQGHSNTPAKSPGRLVSALGGRYEPQQWTHEISRPGGCKHEELPSRMGNTLVYRDGRQEKLK